jgi:hypothetical protein
MQEATIRLTKLFLSLAELSWTSQELSADSAALCETSRMLRKRSEQRRTAGRNIPSLMRLQRHSAELHVRSVFTRLTSTTLVD